MQSSTITERMQELMLAQWEELLRLRQVVLRTSGSEASHDLRVASRRFRAVVGLFEPWLISKHAALLKKKCRKLTHTLGALRNIDEALSFFRLHPPGGRYRICHLFEELRSGELSHVKKSLMSLDHRRLDRIVRKEAAELHIRFGANKQTPMPVYFSDAGLRLFQPIYNLLPTATSPGQREARHALRIAIKKLRYLFEIVAQIQECDCRSLLEQLKEYQTILGRMNDMAEFGNLCSSLALSRHERRLIETILQTEDQSLLQKFAELMEQKPLDHSTAWKHY